MLTELDPADARDGHAELDCGGLAARLVVLGFLQWQDDVNGFYQNFHGDFFEKNRQECLYHIPPRIARFRPASSTLTKVTRVEKMGLDPAFSSMTFTE